MSNSKIYDLEYRRNVMSSEGFAIGIEKRSKLFAEKAYNLRSKRDLQELWSDEFIKLSEKYEYSSNTIKSYSSSYYRPELIKRYNIKFSLKREHLKERLDTTKKIREKQFIWIYSVVKLPLNEFNNIKKNRAIKISKRLKKVSLINNITKMIKLSKDNLANDNYETLVLSVCFLTGRRPIEVVKTGIFKKVSKYEIEFSGKAKGKSKSESKKKYKIYCLTDSNEVINAISKIRIKKPFKEYYNTFTKEYNHIKIHDSISRMLSKKVREIFNFNIDCDCIKCKKRNLYFDFLSNIWIVTSKYICSEPFISSAKTDIEKLSKTKIEYLMAKNISNKFTKEEKKAVCRRLTPYSLRRIYAKICIELFFYNDGKYVIDDTRAIAELLLHDDKDNSTANSYKDFEIKDNEKVNLKEYFSDIETSDTILEKDSSKEVKIKKENSLDKYDKLDKLNDLYKKGILTKKEFKKEKQRILNE